MVPEPARATPSSRSGAEGISYPSFDGLGQLLALKSCRLGGHYGNASSRQAEDRKRERAILQRIPYRGIVRLQARTDFKSASDIQAAHRRPISSLGPER